MKNRWTGETGVACKLGYDKHTARMNELTLTDEDAIDDITFNEKDELNVPEYLVKVTKFSTSLRQAIEYSKIIYDMFVRRELIKISEQTIDTAKLNDLNTNGQTIIENSERLLFDLAEKGSYNSSLMKFEEAMRFCRTMDMPNDIFLWMIQRQRSAATKAKEAC